MAPAVAAHPLLLYTWQPPFALRLLPPSVPGAPLALRLLQAALVLVLAWRRVALLLRRAAVSGPEGSAGPPAGGAAA